MRGRLLLLSTVLIAVALNASGCVVYRGEEPPPEPATLPLSAPLCSSFVSTTRYQHEGKDVPGASPRMEGAVADGIRQAGAVGPNGPQRALRIDVIENERSSLVMAFICGLTVFLVPAWAENEISVTASIVENTKTIARAEAHGSVKTVMEFFLVFALPFQDLSTGEKLIGRLVRCACADLAGRSPRPGDSTEVEPKADMEERPASPPPAAPDGAPLPLKKAETTSDAKPSPESKSAPSPAATQSPRAAPSSVAEPAKPSPAVSAPPKAEQPKSHFCGQCGRRFEGDGKFCPECGAPR
jgi:hypothetical protein